ncbi:class I SAM-dependent methyltransferase [Rhizomonospora bruguierae]|uniref:class I SAM-dependent methyltransferase n=1 Tax=Rhizomonospora bruguierae TaxID=1581705 RepID=UPI001BD02247|nr:class I SAM-dependent methyltransferase [Micromonospora sp. NBRC 107566]
MAMMEYDAAAARGFVSQRGLTRSGLAGWRVAVQPYLSGRGTLLDVGAGTGVFADAFAGWYGTRVLAVEPSSQMLRLATRSPGVHWCAGTATALPLAAGVAGAGWLSTVVHHIADLAAAARELRRVLTPGAPVLIRGTFPGRWHRIALFRYFPEAGRVIDERYPAVSAVEAAFATAGYRRVCLEPVGQPAPRVMELAATLNRSAHTPLRLLADGEYRAGLARLRAAAAGPDTRPAMDYLDLLVLR